MYSLLFGLKLMAKMASYGVGVDDCVRLGLCMNGEWLFETFLKARRSREHIRLASGAGSAGGQRLTGRAQ